MNEVHVIFAGYLRNGRRESTDSFLIEKFAEICKSKGYCLTIVESIDNKVGMLQLNDTRFKHIIRRNYGYDFGSWNEAINREESQFRKSIFINSSCVGPINSNLEKFLEKFVDNHSDAHFLTESRQIRSHGQSFCWSLNKKVINNPQFRKFFNSNLNNNSREFAISQKELKLNSIFRSIGASVNYSYPAGTLCTYEKNPSLHGWKRLIKAGYPFLKKSVINNYLSQKDLDWLINNKLMEPNYRFLLD